MSWMELRVDAECAHCGSPSDDTSVAFNLDEADYNGVNSQLTKEYCGSCDKDFWFKAYCAFEVECFSVYKTKPKAKKNKV